MFDFTKAYNFHHAVEYVDMSIRANFTSFPIATEFGHILVEVTGKYHDSFYRYSTSRWKDCPINKTTESHLRTNHYMHYISIEKVDSPKIQKLMIVMAMTECLLRYVTDGNEDIIKEDRVNTLAAIYMKTFASGLTYNPDVLASEYLKTLPIRRHLGGGKAAIRTSMVKFFEGVMDKAAATLRKNAETENDYPERIDFDETFHENVFIVVARWYDIKFTKDSDYYKRYVEYRDDETVHSIPHIIRYVMTKKY